MVIEMNKSISPKEEAIYKAVLELFEEGAELESMTVSEITRRAGIGKGTAYEYFSDKEEMIAKALFYNAEIFSKQLYDGVCKEKNIYDKVNYVLVMMEKQIKKMNCIFRLLHMLPDNSAISRRIREMGEAALSEEMPAIDIVRRMLTDEFRVDLETSTETMEYIVMNVYSRLLCFGMLINESRYRQIGDIDIIRELTCQGICREIEEIGNSKRTG